MMSTRSMDALTRQIQMDEYVVDAHAVAEAMLRRPDGLLSPVLVAAQSRDRAAVGVEQREAAAGDGLA
ncbi:MAG: hypothetical protein QOH58_1182 [Thermoleophilaceae bacterium]|jgi:hypothetical protein|nr:hypothetical protein [Thermoleophilaceae bacterium]